MNAKYLNCKTKVQLFCSLVLSVLLVCVTGHACSLWTSSHFSDILVTQALTGKRWRALLVTPTGDTAMRQLA